jgi:hypothetical protein
MSYEKSGFLTKQGKLVKNWKKRWFVLKDNVLYYYKTKDYGVGPPAGTIFLQQGTVPPAARRTPIKGKYFFEIRTQERTFILYADFQRDMEEWITAINRCATSTEASRLEEVTLTLGVQCLACKRCFERVKAVITSYVGNLQTIRYDLNEEQVTLTGSFKPQPLLERLREAGYPSVLISSSQPT